MALKTFVFIFVLILKLFLKAVLIKNILANKLFKNIPFFINRILKNLVNHIFCYLIGTFDMIQYETKQRRPLVTS